MGHRRKPTSHLPEAIMNRTSFKSGERNGDWPTTGGTVPDTGPDGCNTLGGPRRSPSHFLAMPAALTPRRAFFCPQLPALPCVRYGVHHQETPCPATLIAAVVLSAIPLAALAQSTRP